LLSCRLKTKSTKSKSRQSLKSGPEWTSNANGRKGARNKLCTKYIEDLQGHSLRAGYATSAAVRNMPAYRIQSHTRHNSAAVVAGYIREADKWTKSGLDGVGF
jgi:hypothetical protein